MLMARHPLPGQAAGGYVTYDAGAGRYRLTEAQALVPFNLVYEARP
jgi:hypothetical protein